MNDDIIYTSTDKGEVCGLCSALVSSQSHHTAWHLDLRDAIRYAGRNAGLLDRIG